MIFKVCLQIPEEEFTQSNFTEKQVEDLLKSDLSYSLAKEIANQINIVKCCKGTEDKLRRFEIEMVVCTKDTFDEYQDTFSKFLESSSMLSFKDTRYNFREFIKQVKNYF